MPASRSLRQVSTASCGGVRRGTAVIRTGGGQEGGLGEGAQLTGTHVDAVCLHLLVVVPDGVQVPLHLAGHCGLAPLRKLAEGAVVLDGQVPGNDGNGNAVLPALLRDSEADGEGTGSAAGRSAVRGATDVPGLPGDSRTLTQAMVRSTSKKNWVMIKSAPASILPLRRSRSSWRACSEGGRSGWFQDSMWTSGYPATAMQK